MLRMNYVALVDQLPKMSPQTTQLLRVLSKSNCSVSELTEIAQRDAALTARILRTANSATFGRLQAVTSLRHAISIQGVNVLRKFVLGASVSNLFSRSKTTKMFSMTRFNLHSVATATVLDILAELLPIENQDQAFVAGLLHDVGEMILAINCPAEYEQSLALCAVSGESRLECERKMFGMDHAHLSSLAVARWQLDDALRTAVAMHHEPEPLTNSKRIPLSNAIEQADRFVDSLGISILPSSPESLPASTLEFPGHDLDMEEFRSRFQVEWLKLSEMFQ